MSPDDIRVPIKAWLRGPTFRRLEHIAAKRRATIGDLLAELADRAVEPVEPTKERARAYVHITTEMRDQIAALDAVGLGASAIARAVGCSVASVYNHLPKENP